MKMQAGCAMLATLACSASVRGQIQAESHNLGLNWKAHAAGVNFCAELGFVGTFGMDLEVEVGTGDPWTTLALELGQVVGPAISWSNYPELGITDGDVTNPC